MSLSPVLYLMKWLLLYPASGRREHTSGVFGSMGSEGRCWSVALTGTNGYFLYFHSTYINPIGNNSRAYGHDVRCVQYLLSLLRFRSLT